MLMLLGLAFVGFGAWVGLEVRARVPFFAFLFPTSVLLALGVSRLGRRRRRAVPRRIGKERELLWAIRDNAGSITPAEAAMETSLTVGEADEMLSRWPAGATSWWKAAGAR